MHSRSPPREPPGSSQSTPGIGGVTIDLVDVSSGSVVASTTTAADGSYLFTGLLPGAYVARVTGGLPTGAVQTGDPTVPGVPCGASCDNESSAVILTTTSNLLQDFGYQTPALSNISGTVFIDPDRDGLLDVGEARPNQPLNWTP